MKLSRFMMTVLDYPKPGSFLLHHTRTQAKVVISQPFFDLLEKIKKGYEPTAEERRYLEALKPGGFVLEASVDEARQLDHWLNQIRYHSRRLDSIVLVTYECNFGCVYCIQEGVKGRRLRMDSDMAQQTGSWLIQKAVKLRVDELCPTFYGGEPLLNIEAIETVSKMMLAFAEAKQKSYQFHLISNGSLLSEKILNKLLPLGFAGIKVTLDGEKEVHDLKRPFAGGQGSFDKILANIENAIGRVPVKINFNFNQENYQSFSALLDILETRGLKDHIAEIDPNPIIGNYEKKSLPHQAQRGCLSLNQPGITEVLVELKKEVQERGFKHKPAMGINVCEAMNSEGYVIIDPEGILYRCPALVGRKEFAVGHVEQKEFNTRYLQMMTMDMWKNNDCYECAFAPMCAGGCRFLSYLRTGDFFKPDCEKGFFQKTSPEFIKLDHKQIALLKRSVDSIADKVPVSA